jgi:signal recognition particle subunit SRP19
MSTILPHYSPGLTGGGVSENFLKDMMAEMQNAGGAPGLGGGMPDMAALQGMMGGAGMGPSASGSGGEGKPKKEKKKKIKG